MYPVYAGVLGLIEHNFCGLKFISSFFLSARRVGLCVISPSHCVNFFGVLLDSLSLSLFLSH